MEGPHADTALVELLAAALDVVPHPLIVSDFRSVLFANAQMRALLGYSDRSELEGLDPLQIVHPDVHEAMRARRELLSNGSRGLTGVPTKLLAADSSVIAATVTIIPLRHEGFRCAVFTFTPRP